MTDNNLTAAISTGESPRDEMDLEADKIEAENIEAENIEEENIEEESIEESTLPPPKLNIEAKAAEFFSNKFFYDGDETFAANPIRAKLRAKKFGDKTVREVLKEITLERDVAGYFDLFNSGYDAIRSYWREIRVSLEERLNGQILTLTDGSGIEIKLINERYVDLPLFTSANLGDRENDIRVVLGPSGSGKTFFAVKVAAAFNTSDHAEPLFSMVIYFKAELFMKELNADDLKPLGQAIEKSIKRSQGEVCFGAEKDALPLPLLQMHVSVVIDEAGSEHDRYFEDILNLKRIYVYLEENIGKSVRLIVGGTGLTAEKLNSESDVHKYRMKAWSKAHFEKVAGTRFLNLPTYLLDFAQTLPMLHALTSNARAAWFLLDELTKYAKFHKLPEGNIQKEEWEYMLYNLSITLESIIVPQVAAQYIQGNGLKNLNKKSSIHVAAMVFCEVDKSMQEEGPSTPDFKPYTEDPTERKMANALINVNVDFKDGALKYADETKKSILVSPAITIVLFYLLGVEVGVLSSWKGLEVMTALHAFRKLVIHTFSKNYESLQKVRLIFLQARIPETNARITIKTPTFNPYTVWINGDTAPFADVVAPDFLFQCKHTEKDSSPVKCNLYLELRKCGLLLQDDSSNGKVGRVTLHGIMKHWVEISPKVEEITNAPHRKKSKGESKLCVESKRAVGDDNENNIGNDSMHEQCLIFYPEIEIETASALKDAGIEFAKYNVDEIDEILRKGHDFSRELNFVVATNAKEIVLSFKKEEENSEKKKNKKLSDVKDPDVAILLPNLESRVTNKDIDIKEAHVLNEIEENSGNSDNSENKKKTVVKDADVLSTLTNWELRVTNKDINENGILTQADVLNEIKKMIRGNVTLRFYLGG